MVTQYLKMASFALIVLSTTAGATQNAEGRGGKPAFLTIGNPTSIPYGWVDFCYRYKTECDTAVQKPVSAELTSENLKLIESVNTHVNTTIIPKSDMEHWGVIDQWDYPSDGYGDCEDYALLKRKMLIKAGLPRQSLLITVVRDREGEGHAILTVHTNRGDIILDNLNNDVKLWHETGYAFVKRQDAQNQNQWVELIDPLQAVAMASR
jgi:predicted transglutaminase-like cysteine proteinase